MYACVKECKSDGVSDERLNRWMKVMRWELQGREIAGGLVRMGGS